MSESATNQRKLYTCIILEKDDHIFLIKRGNTGWMDGYWSIPGGGLEECETITECVIRESKEEIDILIHQEHLEFVHILETQTEERNAMGFYFSTKIWHGDIKNAEPHEHSEIGWFHIDQLPSPIIPAGKHVLEQYKKKTRLSHLKK